MSSRIVSGEDVGLDEVLSGGFRLFARYPGGEESGSLLIRGAPGTGKSILGSRLGHAVAKALGADVLIACVEILPTEMLEQLQRFDWAAGVEIIDLHQQRSSSANRATSAIGLGLLDLGSTNDPDFSGALSALRRHAAGLGIRPRVLVIDSLARGYGLDSASDRLTADAVCKWAAEVGWFVILLEEAVDLRPTAWGFAVDTVIELQADDSGRWLRVAKSRFASSDPRRHYLEIDKGGPSVSPDPATWRALGYSREVSTGNWQLGTIRWEGPSNERVAVYGADLSDVSDIASKLAGKGAFDLRLGDLRREWQPRRWLRDVLTELRAEQPATIVVGDLRATETSVDSAGLHRAVEVLCGLAQLAGVRVVTWEVTHTMTIPLAHSVREVPIEPPSAARASTTVSTFRSFTGGPAHSAMVRLVDSFRTPRLPVSKNEV